MNTAVFGGTFDPVHTGHIRMVNYALDKFGLDRLTVIPNANPPHKRNEVNTDYSHRYNMLRLAFEGVDRVEISDYESVPGKEYYSLYTMRHFRSIYGDNTRFIIGADSLCTIHRWYEAETFLRENCFIVFPRENNPDFAGVLKSYQDKGVDILVADMPEVDISSTSVRTRLCNGEIPGDMLPASVAEYICANGLYGGVR